MDNLHPNIRFALENYLPVKTIRQPSEAELQVVRQALPGPLFELVEARGYCSFHDGLFRTCHPHQFRPLLDSVFAGDPDFDADETSVIGYTAFGDLYVWSPRFYNFPVRLAEGFVFCRALTLPEWKPLASAEHIASGSLPDQESADFLDCESLAMFDACRTAHGDLEDGECYGFFPALSVAGICGPSRRVDNIRRVKVAEHLAMLAQWSRPQLIKLVPDGLLPVRMIGSA